MNRITLYQTDKTDLWTDYGVAIKFLSNLGCPPDYALGKASVWSQESLPKLMGVCYQANCTLLIKKATVYPPNSSPKRG